MFVLLAVAVLFQSDLCYEGTVGAGPRERRIVLSVSPAGEGQLRVFGRPTQSIPLMFSLDSAGYRRALAPDGVTGARVRSDGEAHVALLRSRDTVQATLRLAAPVPAGDWMLGDWTGTVGEGFATRLGIHVERGPCGLLVGVLDSPDQGQNGLPLTGVRVWADSAAFEASYLDLRVAMVRGLGNERAAVMRQRGSVSGFVLRRGARVTEARRPQDPVRPFPYSEREVRYAGGAPGIRLAGTLTLPAGVGPHPAVILISGSGAQDRDETVAGHRPFLIVADHLTRRGYAVLRMDDRGAGQSSGNPLLAGLDDLAWDVQVGLTYLRSTPEIDGSRIGLLGHSEGAYVAQKVSALDAGIAFMVLLAGPTVRGRDVLTAQRSALALAAGDPAPVREVDSLFIDRIFAVLDTRPRDSALAGEVDLAIAGWKAALDAPRRVIADSLLAGRTAAQDSASIALWQSPWFQSLYRFDPQPILAGLRIPVLSIAGELDRQVPTSQSAPALERAFAGRSHLLTMVRLPGVNHMLQPAVTGRIEEYATIDQTFAPGVLEGLASWLARVAPVASPPR